MNWTVLLGVFAASVALSSGNLAQTVFSGGFVDKTTCRTADLAEIQRKFALELYRQVSEAEGGGKNVVLSPAVIYMGLSMLWMGAANNTKTEMQKALYLENFFKKGERKEVIACIFNEYLNVDSNSPLTLELVSKIFADSSLNIDETFLTFTGEFGAFMEQVNFQSDAESARNYINNWVYEHTGNRITELFPSGTLDSFTKLVLASAIYFKGTWVQPFTNLKNSTFQLSEDETEQVTYMSGTFNTSYWYDYENDLELVELPYSSIPGDLQISMILIPSYFTFDYLATEKQWTPSSLHQAINNLMNSRKQEVEVKMPMFEIFGEYDMKQHLSALGFGEIFQAGVANFYGINGGNDLYVNSALQKAYLKVDKTGTEAAAAFGASVVSLSLPPQVVLHKPFHYILYEKTTKTFLFMGRVMNPNL